jgi:hypothetical protein
MQRCVGKTNIDRPSINDPNVLSDFTGQRVNGQAG